MSNLTKQTVDTRVTVETPEGVDFEFVIAGPGKRAVAFVIDWIIKIAAITLTLFLAGLFVPFGTAGRGLGIGMWLAMFFVIDWFYHSFFETIWNGQTPGKRSQRLRVVRSNGTPITAGSAIGRNFLLAADCQPSLGVGLYTVGLLTMLSTQRMQRTGDLIFDTMVIDEQRERISRAAGVTQGIDPLLRSECSVRFSIPERTLAVIERLFEGDRLISDGRREEIARPLSLALRARLGWEEPGPDPANPHFYFAQTPHRHTQFLRRVLRTFGEPDDASVQSGRRAAERPVAEGRLRSQRSTRLAAADRRVSLDEWVATDEIDDVPGASPADSAGAMSHES